jgi:hypothetical protein
LNFATDAWTSPNHKAYVAVTIHFEESGIPVSMLLDLVQVATSHSGVNLAVVFAKILEDFGISDKVSDLTARVQSLLTCIKILSITCDNASNNDTMIEELGDLVDAFPGEANRTRCFAHIINLIAKSVIKQFDIPKARAGDILDGGVEELSALARDIELEEWVTRASVSENDENDDDNFEDWEDERLGLSKELLQKLDDDVQPVRQVLVKVCSVEHVFANDELN